jgi:hypothetical protein
MSLEVLAPFLRRSLGTIKRYASTGDKSLEPPDVVIERLKATVRNQAFDALEAAGRSVRYRDYDQTTEVAVQYDDSRPRAICPKE